jgi:pSer/pThr/pTyr-binding forkhead associated (FHA) protein
MNTWVLESTEPALVIRLTPGAVKTLGRTARADFIVDAPLVSRIHCRLTSDASHELIVEDLDSTNGTLVNGTRITRAVLRPGDVLTVGRVEFRVGAPDLHADTDADIDADADAAGDTD